MAIHRLSPRQVATSKPGKKEDGGGLRLVTSGHLSRRWVLRYTLRNRRREMGLGPYPEVGLADARRLAQAARRLVHEGIDPIDARAAERAVPTFTHCAAQYIRSKRREWSSIKHARQWVATMKTYVRPAIGSKPVDIIATEDVLSVLEPIWLSKTETAKRVQGRVEAILDFAGAMKYRDNNNPARWRGHLDKILPAPSQIAPVKHHEAMPYAEVAAFMEELAPSTDAAPLALQFLILTAMRTEAVIGATWDEIDFDAGIWTVPKERMKGRRVRKKDHRVPLSTPALETLKRTPRMANSLFLFPNRHTGKALSSNAMRTAMRDRGIGKGLERGPYVPHGFRSSFRDWAGEVATFPIDLAEMALAHALKDKTEAAYARGDLLEKRRKLMEAWGLYATTPISATVLPITKKA